MRFIIFLSGKFFAGTVVRNYFSTSKLGIKEDATENTQYARKRARFQSYSLPPLVDRGRFPAVRNFYYKNNSFLFIQVLPK